MIFAFDFQKLTTTCYFWSNLFLILCKSHVRCIIILICLSRTSTLSLTLWFLPVCWWPEGKACPAAAALEEWRVCNDHPCMVFYWETSAWGPCFENVSMDLNVTSFWNGTPTCAVGVQIRKVSCMKVNSGHVISKRYAL